MGPSRNAAKSPRPAPLQGKTFLLDTNVLIHDPDSFSQFAGARVVIPLAVISELDGFKRLNDERGYSVRKVTRLLNTLAAKGSLSRGVKLSHGGMLSIEHRASPLPAGIGGTVQKDNEILATALYLKERGEKVVLISKDMNLRIKAEVLGLEAEDYEREKIPVEQLYMGWREAAVEPEVVKRFFDEKGLKGLAETPDLQPNEFVLLKAGVNGAQSALARFRPGEGLVPLVSAAQKPWGVRGINFQQRFALELLLDPAVSLVCLVGVPGSGKTLLALAAGLEQVFEKGRYRRLLISRPVIPVGRDIGFLPGTKEEKLSSWTGAIRDNVEYLCDAGEGGQGEGLARAREILESEKVEIEAVSFLRGRSLPRVYFIIDDAQNLTPHEVKTIISRAGEGTKVVLTGDPMQIDNPYLDPASNGLSNLVERFKGQKVFGAVKFDRIVRSDLAALATELL